MEYMLRNNKLECIFIPEHIEKIIWFSLLVAYNEF